MDKVVAQEKERNVTDRAYAILSDAFCKEVEEKHALGLQLIRAKNSMFSKKFLVLWAIWFTSIGWTLARLYG